MFPSLVFLLVMSSAMPAEQLLSAALVMEQGSSHPGISSGVVPPLPQPPPTVKPDTECFCEALALLKAEIKQFLQVELLQIQENIIQNLTNSIIRTQEMTLNRSTSLDPASGWVEMIDSKITAIQDDLRQELGSVQAAVREDQAVIETNIVRRLNETINEHNRHNNNGQKQYFKQNQDDRNDWGLEMKKTNAYLRDIHPLVQSLYDHTLVVELLAAGWISFGSSYYYFPPKSAKCPVDICRSKCQAMGNGADLLVVESAAEQDFIVNYVENDPNLQYDVVYLNLYKSTPDVLPGTWVNKATGETITYSNWNPGQPSYTWKRVAALERTDSYRWADAEGNRSYNYICKIEIHISRLY